MGVRDIFSILLCEKDRRGMVGCPRYPKLILTSEVHFFSRAIQNWWLTVTFDGPFRFPREGRSPCYHSNIHAFLRPLGYLGFRIRVSNLFTLILLRELPCLTHINHKFLEIPTQNQCLNFFPQVKAFGGALAEIFMKLTILQDTLHIGVFPNWLRWAKQHRIPNMVKNLFWRLIQIVERVISGFLWCFPLFWR